MNIVRAKRVNGSSAYTRMRTTHIRAGLVMVLSFYAAGIAVGQGTSNDSLFPMPFVGEHYIIETGADGEVSEMPKVTDYFAGSWLISVRQDGSRMVIDFSKSEIREVFPKQGTYSIVSYSRFAELSRRFAQAQAIVERTPDSPEDKEGSKAAAGQEKPRFVIEEVKEQPPTGGEKANSDGTSGGLIRRNGVKHVRVSLANDTPESGRTSTIATPSVEVWLDPGIRLTPAARAALNRFERDVVGSGRLSRQLGVAQLIAAARDWGEGAFPIRTQRAVPGKDPGVTLRRISHVYTKLEPLSNFPYDLLAIPEGMRRAPLPLEAMVAYMEEQAAEIQKAQSAKEVGRR